MSDSLAVDRRKLEWCGKLSLLLLNDGTNSLRWFLKENLPRKYNEEAHLDEILEQNRGLFIDLCKQPNQVINREMFDILYRKGNEKTKEADLEIYLLFILIRYLCELKHWSWKWWEEDPADHQVAPIFDVIRIFRFKQRMKAIAHDYEITEEKFIASWNYVTSVLDRLQSYKVSSRRWRDDVIKSEAENDEAAYVSIIETMRWQALDLKRREELYSSLKRSELEKYEKNDGSSYEEFWSGFASHFGQMRASGLARLDRSKAEIARTENQEAILISGNPDQFSPAQELHGNYRSLLAEKKITKAGRSSSQTVKKDCDLLPAEVVILNGIDNDVFIEDYANINSLFAKPAMLLREDYITNHCTITPLSLEHRYCIHMDDVSFNLEAMRTPVRRAGETCGDIPLVKMEAKLLESWRELLMISESPLRVMVGGEPSSGKTTLLRKIAYDWATRNSTELWKYNLVFYIDLSLVEVRYPYTSLSECIIEQCLKNCSLGEVEELFNDEEGDGILLLFDGAELMPDAASDAMSELSEIICGKRLTKCSVILTTNFTTDFEALAERRRFANAFYFDQRSSRDWQRVTVLGFTTYDVIAHARLFLEWTVNGENSNEDRPTLDAIQFLNFCKVFQRDVYKTVISSPTCVYLLAYLWKSLLDAQEHLGNQPKYPETFGESMHAFVKNLSFRPSDSSFWEEVLKRALNGVSGGIYTFNNESLLSGMKEDGIVRGVRDHLSFRFTNHIFEAYCAAKWFCVGSNEHANSILQDRLQHLDDALHLRNFLLFCCSFDKSSAEVITSTLSQLIKNNINNPDVKVQNQLEAVKHLTLQCFYEMNSVTQLPFSAVSHGDGVKGFRKNGHELRLRRVDLLSSRSKQAVLFLTTQCRPHLTTSGTVFPFTDVTSFWLRRVHLSCLRGEQLAFVSGLLRNLRFLEEATFDDVTNLEDEHVRRLCDGLKLNPESSKSGSGKSSKFVLHSFTLTQKMDTAFDTCLVTTYKEIGDLLEDLPFLEELHLSIPNPALLFSLFDTRTFTPVPLTTIEQSESGFTLDHCKRLASLMKRLRFLEKLDLSFNPIGDGLRYISKGFCYLPRLQTINVSKSCLTPASVSELADNFKWMPMLKSFDMSENHVQDKNAVIKIINAFQQLPLLASLDLSHNFLGDESVCALAKSLGVHGKISTLKLNSVQMSATALSSLKLQLRQCSQLKVLSLAGNFFNSRILEFAEVLYPMQESGPGLTDLQILDLSGVSSKHSITIDPSSVNLFLKCIENHKNLRWLNLKNVRIERFNLTLILQGCENHSSLKEICFSKKLLNMNEEESRVWSCLKLV